MTIAHTLTSEESRRGAERSNAVQAAERHQLRRVAYQTAQLVTAVEDGEIGQTAYETALDILQAIADRTASGLPLDESIDIYRAAQVADTIFKIGRLATGQSTSNALSATVDQSDLEARRAAALARLQPTTPEQPA